MITRTSGTRPWWSPSPPPCRDCKEQGNHVNADIQVRGVWLCHNHHEIRIRQGEELWVNHPILPLRR